MDDVITSRQNPLVQMARKLQTSRAYRQETGRFAADGVKLLQEAARWCDGLETVLTVPGTQLPDLPATVRVAAVRQDIMAYASQMEAPQGALFLCRMPQTSQVQLQPGALVLDGLQDPGNLGTILRTADALGAPMAVLTPGCADVWNPKTVRASMGAVFRLGIAQMTAAEVAAACRSQGLTLLASALTPTAVPIGEVSVQNAVMVVGSEGQGIGPELLAAADRHVIIPMRPRCESLNAGAAAAVLLWEMARRGAFVEYTQEVPSC